MTIKEKFSVLAAPFAALAAFAYSPTVSNVSFSYSGGRQPAMITYMLSDAPAIVTIDIETNTLADASGEWVNIGGEAVGRIYGQGATVVWITNKVVKAYWLPGESWPNQNLLAGTIRASVTAFPTNSPPDYMVVDLASPTNLAFYTCEKSLPGGIGSDLYRTNSMVMRRIPAANVVWRMGMLEGESEASILSTPHNVLLTEDYYMGVFELTQGQYTMFASNPSTYRHFYNSAWYPLDHALSSNLRGQDATENDPYGWPREDHAVSPTSVIGLMRAQTGLSKLDLPTEAQWEYACRAGTGTPINSGQANPVAADWRQVAWYSGTTFKTNGNNVTSIVGKLKPNNWGLYDMHANASEVCLDWYEGEGSAFIATFQTGWEDGAVTTNPVGIAWADATVGSSRSVVKRGGSVAHGVAAAYSGRRGSGGIAYGAYYIGCRLVCPISDVANMLPNLHEEEEVTE